MVHSDHGEHSKEPYYLCSITNRTSKRKKKEFNVNNQKTLIEINEKKNPMNYLTVKYTKQNKM